MINTQWELTFTIKTDPTTINSQKALDTLVAAAATALEAVAGVNPVQAVRLNSRPYSPITPYLPNGPHHAEPWS